MQSYDVTNCECLVWRMAGMPLRLILATVALGEAIVRRALHVLTSADLKMRSFGQDKGGFPQAFGFC